MAKGYIVERTVDRLGRIVIPSDMRKMMKVDIGTRVVITATNNGVVIKPANADDKKQSIPSKMPFGVSSMFLFVEKNIVMTSFVKSLEIM